MTIPNESAPAGDCVLVPRDSKLISDVMGRHAPSIFRGNSDALPEYTYTREQTLAMLWELHGRLAAAPVRATGGELREVSPAQIEQGWRDTFSVENPFCPCDLKSFGKAVRWALRQTPAIAPAEVIGPNDPMPKDWCTLAVGDGSGRLFVHGHYDAIKICQDALLARNEAAIAPAGDEFHCLPCSDQIGKLADFILREVPGEPSQSQGAVDTAIRLLRERIPAAGNAVDDAMVERAAAAFYGDRWPGVDTKEYRAHVRAALTAALAAPQDGALTVETAPVGTLAPAIGGGHWCRVQHGWKWNGPNGSGSTFPRPGADWTGKLTAPQDGEVDHG